MANSNIQEPASYSPQSHPQTNSGYQEVYLNFIGGQWRQGSSGSWDSNRNPARPSEILGKYTKSNAADAQKAVEAAQKALTDWSALPRAKRGQIVGHVAHLLKAKAETFAKTITREMGKNLTEARSEVQKTIAALEFAAAEARRPLGAVRASDSTLGLTYTSRSPLGVAAILSSWRSPLCAPAWKIAPALIEGNTVVFKPSTLTPATATLFVRLFEEASLPVGTLNLIYGAGATVGKALVEDPRVKLISFSGSNPLARTLAGVGAARHCRVALESGSKNAIIVFADADLDQAASATVLSAFGCAGQRLSATSRVIVEKSVYSAFTVKLIEKTRALKVGDGLKDAQAMGPLIDEKQHQAVLQEITLAKKDGVELLVGGEDLSQASSDKGWFVSPTIFGNVSPKSRLAQVEVSGPVLAVISADSAEHAVEIANSVESCVSNSLFTRSLDPVLSRASRIRSQILHVNGPTIEHEMGQEMSSLAFESYAETKTVIVASAGTIPTL